MSAVSLGLTQPSCPVSNEHTWERQHLETMRGIMKRRKEEKKINIHVILGHMHSHYCSF